MLSCDSVFYILTIASLQNFSGIDYFAASSKTSHWLFSLLGCDMVVRCVVPHILKDQNTFIFRVKQGKAVILLLALLHPEDEDSVVLWNIRSYTPDVTVSHSRRTECFAVLLWEHSISLLESTSLFLQVFYVQAVHQKVRRQCVQFIKRNKHKFEEVIDLQFCCCMRLLAFVWKKIIMNSERRARLWASILVVEGERGSLHKYRLLRKVSISYI